MSTIKADTLSNLLGTLSVPVATAVQGSAKAWVNFNGTGTVAIRASFNVSSITDNGTGDYTVNFTTAMTDANYAFVATVSANTIASGSGIASAPFNTTPTASACRFVSATSAATFDPPYAHVAVFR